jgi:hypothetical protein
VAFVCKDDPALIRANIAKRKDILTDDRVTIDTFHDHKRAYFLDVNPYGVQLDGVTTNGKGDDFRFETLWYTAAKITWGRIRGAGDYSFPQPAISRYGEAELVDRARPHDPAQQRDLLLAARPPPPAAAVRGAVRPPGRCRGVSPGRNLQFIPYAVFSPARFLAVQATGPIGFVSDREARGGLDAKAILRGSVTLDATLNPDFSQVESDEPRSP